MKKIVKIFPSLGTLNTITIYFENEYSQQANITINKIEEFINDLDDRFSVFKPTSEWIIVNKVDK